MKKTQKLIIVGDSSFAEIAYEYFTHDSNYEVCAFSVEQAYIKNKLLFGLPVVPFEELTQSFSPHEYSIFVATVYTQLNRLRTRLYLQAKEWGYHIASYVSSKAFIWPNVVMGEHCFIFENNTVQPFVRLGSNNILWSGNHIGHHSVIQNNCFISSHVVICGHCVIEDNCFLGVNSTISAEVTVQKNCIIGAGALVLKHTEKDSVYKGIGTEPSPVSSYRIFRIPEEI